MSASNKTLSKRGTAIHEKDLPVKNLSSPPFGPPRLSPYPIGVDLPRNSWNDEVEMPQITFSLCAKLILWVASVGVWR